MSQSFSATPPKGASISVNNAPAGPWSVDLSAVRGTFGPAFTYLITIVHLDTSLSLTSSYRTSK
jgi:hypothetical protein